MKNYLLKFALIICSMYFCKNSHAIPSSIKQVPESQVLNNTPNQDSNGLTKEEVVSALKKKDSINKAIDGYVSERTLKSNELILSILLIILASALFLAEIIIFYKGLLSSSQISKLLLLTFIIFATLFLIAVGYSNEQIAPAMALFGTIAGYLLGKSPSTPDKLLVQDITQSLNGSVELTIENATDFVSLDLTIDGKPNAYKIDTKTGKLIIQDLMAGTYKLNIKATKIDNSVSEKLEEITIKQKETLQKKIKI